MKKLSSLLIIICFLLTSCQVSAPEITPTSGGEVSFSTEGSTQLYIPTEYVSESVTGVSGENTEYITSGKIENSFSSPQAVITQKPTADTPKPSLPSTKPVQTTAKPTTTVPTTVKPTVPVTKPAPAPTEMRAIWISCYDYTSAAGKTRLQYKAITDRMFRNIKANGLNTAFVHLRANSDAFYKSDIFPYSSYIAGKEGASLSFDPFEVLLESAKANGISVHGWINPFRVSTRNNASLLSASNPAKKILDSGNTEARVCILSNGIYYNPAHTENHRLILDGVREILRKYDIDGIHIDDYFYPTTSESIDSLQYKAYKSSGGTLSLSKWRIANVNSFVSALYSAVKAVDSSVTVSISPSGQIDKTLAEAYADCRTWLSQKGYADLIIPQIYFGFNHQTQDFNKLLRQWSSLPRHSSVKLVCGIAAYKCATEDTYAGTGKKEWQTNTDILARQISAIRSNKAYGGFAVFSYSDLERAACKTEIENMKKTINS